LSGEEKGGGSVSRIELRLSVRGRGEARLSFYRHLAPVTVGTLTRSLPIESRATVQPGMVCLFTSVRVGVEKPRVSFGRGDVAFLPLNSLVCIFLRDAKSERPLNPTGRVDIGLDVLESVKPGDVLTLRQ
jgi:hypothetical protein